MKRPARARVLGGDRAVARWFERVRLANRWEAASAETVDECTGRANAAIPPDIALDPPQHDVNGL